MRAGPSEGWRRGWIPRKIDGLIMGDVVGADQQGRSDMPITQIIEMIL